MDGNRRIFTLCFSLDKTVSFKLKRDLKKAMSKELNSLESLAFRLYNKCNETPSYYNLYILFFCNIDFILNEIFPEKKQEFKLLVELLEHRCSFHQVFMYSNEVVICNFPKSISLNEQGQLHNENGLALEYRDGNGLYCINGETKDSLLECNLNNIYRNNNNKVGT